jgi:hypothetical protein
MFDCHRCLAPISDERALVFKKKLCVDCSNEPRYFGLTVYPHKTGSSVLIHRNGDEETIRQMRRAFKRAR